MAFEDPDARKGYLITSIGAVLLIIAAVGITAWALRNQFGGTTAQHAAAEASQDVAPPPADPPVVPAPASPSSAPAQRPGLTGRSVPRPVVASSDGSDTSVLPVTLVDPEKDLVSADARVGSERPSPPEASPLTRPVDRVIVRPTYDATDVDVRAPTLLTPLVHVPLPDESPRESVPAAIEVVVNEAGTVDSVKATTLPRTIGETLMVLNSLSIAKTWRFQPAVKDGQPVKYRLLVPLDKF
jgi:hypothetical protein